MKAGRNTPQSVLRYIGAWLDRVPDPVALARDLGYSEDDLATLEQRHGAGLLRHLQAVARSRADGDRFLAKQQGRAHPENYTNSHLDAVDDLPTTPPYYDAILDQRRVDGARHLLTAMTDTEQALKERLDAVAGTMVEGEIRRAYVQARRAREKAKAKVKTYELDLAA